MPDANRAQLHSAPRKLNHIRLTGPPLKDIPEDAGPSYPTVLQQVRTNMIKYEQCVILTRIGNFYELYFEHAEKYGPLLNLKVAKRRTSKGPVAMAGFQITQLERYLKILVLDLGHHVAISQEFANDVPGKVKSGGNMFDRRVVRVISPGTTAIEAFIDPKENNYLLGVHLQPSNQSNSGDENTDASETKEIGLAWLDSTSGELILQSTTRLELSSNIARIGPKEIVVDSSLQKIEESGTIALLKQECQAVTFHKPDPDWEPKQDIGEFRTSQFTDIEKAAANLARQYMDTRLPGWEVSLQPPQRLTPRDFMAIDKNTLRALELRATLRDGNFEGCLLHTIRRTVTQGGARLLSKRLTSPSMSLDEINARLDLVSQLVADEALQENLTTRLRPASDIARLVQRFTLGRGTADDLLELSRTIQITQDVEEVLKENSSNGSAFPKLVDRLSVEGPAELARQISEAIDEEGLSEQHRVEESDKDELAGLVGEVLEEAGVEEKPASVAKRLKARQNGSPTMQKTVESGTPDIWIMRQRRSASPMLGMLHRDLDELWEKKYQLETELREKTENSNLTLKWTPGLGHILHLKGRNKGMGNLQDARPVGSSKSTQSFYHSDWTRLGNKIEEAKLRIRTEEQRVFGELRTLVVRNLVKLRQNTEVLDEIDVACSFAALARDKGFVRPIMNLSTTHKIIGGRHPVVETGLWDQGRSFTPNDCNVGDGEQILLITGPNMAGKSTFLRQNALISILAQTGSFVPAEYAEIGLVDKIFSRVGSADNLYQDQSTFMVEMLETAEILKQATPRSFVIMDEVGRGTTPEDGVAVGYACLHHLYYVNRCRALFATHFHALADRTRQFEKLATWCTDVVEEVDGAFSYAHRLRRGVNRRSHALKVARVAGLPQAAIDVAAAVLEDLKSST
ncbi:muts domain V [Saccharata proteae CBS 121410]|uniref:Muts domain V n=1 Tax=Saccharata proteae CBS 121410 TaxID=1314787 RepID=A0A9P4HXD0_9PEZI|nr:muts domain V [Saccharata proteae CBS 121410]